MLVRGIGVRVELDDVEVAEQDEIASDPLGDRAYQKATAGRHAKVRPAQHDNGSSQLAQPVGANDVVRRLAGCRLRVEAGTLVTQPIGELGVPDVDVDQEFADGCLINRGLRSNPDGCAIGLQFGPAFAKSMAHLGEGLPEASGCLLWLAFAPQHALQPETGPALSWRRKEQCKQPTLFHPDGRDVCPVIVEDPERTVQARAHLQSFRVEFG